METTTTRLSQEAAKGLTEIGRRFARRFKECRKHPSEKRVHALRVEARRLLSILDLLEQSESEEILAKIRRMAKKKLDLLDELRDVHVQVLALRHLSREFPELRPVYKQLRKRDDRLAKRVRKKLKNTGTSKLVKRVARLRQDYLDTYLHKEPRASALILRAINKAFSETVQFRRAINPNFTDTIHRTRIAFKKFRYMIEALVTLRRQAGPKRLVRMRDYQTNMGRIQDMEVLLGRLEKFVKSGKGPKAAIAPITNELAQRHMALVREYMLVADELYSFWDNQQDRVEGP